MSSTSVTRRAVLAALARESDAESRDRTTVSVLASRLDTDEWTIREHLDGLVACDLARKNTDGDVRVTITGEELLELDPGEAVIVEPSRSREDQ